MQKKQRPVDNSTTKTETDAVKSPSNQKAEKKTKTVCCFNCYFFNKFVALV